MRCCSPCLCCFSADVACLGAACAGGDAPPAVPRRLRARGAAHPTSGAKARCAQRCRLLTAHARTHLTQHALARTLRSTSWTCAA
jgi:hypothetical protein